MFLKHVAAFAGSAAAMFLIMTPSVGSAASRRIPASDCIVWGSASIESTGYSIRLTNNAANQRVFCPFLDEGGVFLKEDATGVDIQVYDNDANGQACAYLCVGSTIGIGGSCDTGDCTSVNGIGIESLEPTRTVWSTYPSYYGYFYMCALSNASSWDQRLKGWKPHT